MLKTLSVIVIVFCLSLVFDKIKAEVPTWKWAIDIGSDSIEFGNSVTEDSFGNVYLTGVFQSAQLSFNTITIHNPQIGNYSIFLAKFDKSGNTIWAKSIAGTYFNSGNNVTDFTSSDSQGNVYLSGSFVGSFIVFGNDTLKNAGSGDTYIAKYDPSGNLLWAYSWGGVYNDYVSGITTDKYGNLFLTGVFSSPSINLGQFTLANFSPNAPDAYLVKFNSLGKVLWAERVGGASYGSSIAVDDIGNVYLTGQCSDPETFFDCFTIPDSLSYTNFETPDLFIAKYDSLGNVVWVNGFGASDFDLISGIATDSKGNLYIAGNYPEATLKLGNITLKNKGGYDDFLAKINSAGSIMWAQSIGGNGDDFDPCVSCDNLGSVYLAGRFASEEMTLGNFNLFDVNDSSDLSDIFIAKYDSTGNVIWAKSAGGVYGDFAVSIISRTISDIVITGGFGSPTLSFDNSTILNKGNEDVFLSELNEQ